MSFTDEIEGLLNPALEQHPVVHTFESGDYRGASKREMIEMLTSVIDLLVSRDRAISAVVLRLAEGLDEARPARSGRSSSDDGSERVSLRSRLELDLESLAAAGHIPEEGEREVRLRIDENGGIKWFEATRIRVPADELGPSR